MNWPDEHAGDEESGDHEEDVHARVAAGDLARPGVIGQFYLVRPALIVLVAWFVRRRRHRSAGFRTQLRWVFAVAAVASFIDCVIAPYANVNLGYFSPSTRAWELAIGGLLALTPGLDLPSERARVVLGWLGLAAIVGTYLLVWDQHHFPGWYAVFPVAGSVAVIAAGTPQARWSPSYLAQWSPIQSFGDASYSIYLWHWPIIFLFRSYPDDRLRGGVCSC